MLIDQISNDMKDAMKARDASALSTLRMLKSALKNKQIDLMRELVDEEVTTIIKMQIKQLKEGIEIAEKAERPEMAESAKQEIVILEKYLPTQMDDVMLTRVVTEALAAAEIASKAEAGKAMGVAMKAVAGQADGTRVKAVVDSLLVAIFLSVLSNLSFLLFPGIANAASSNTEVVVSGARILRVFLMLMGVVSVNFILLGAVSIMTASGRDHGHHNGLQQIAIGIFGTILMAGLIAIASATIMKLG